MPISTVYHIPENWKYKSKRFQVSITPTCQTQSYTTKENLSKMKFVLILSMLVGFGSAARLGFHGTIYNYGNAGYLSPKQVAAMKRILKMKCIKKYGPRFCWFRQLSLNFIYNFTGTKIYFKFSASIKYTNRLFFIDCSRRGP